MLRQRWLLTSYNENNLHDSFVNLLIFSANIVSTSNLILHIEKITFCQRFQREKLCFFGIFALDNLDPTLCNDLQNIGHHFLNKEIL